MIVYLACAVAFGGCLLWEDHCENPPGERFPDALAELIRFGAWLIVAEWIAGLAIICLLWPVVVAWAAIGEWKRD